MSNLDTGVYGAKVQSWRKANPRDMLKQILDKNPDLNKTEAFDLFYLQASDDPEIVQSIMEYWFVNNYHSLVHSYIPRINTKQIQEEKAKEIKEKVKQKIVEEAKIMLMDLILPNGKQLRHCTGQDCRRAGGWFLKIANKIRPREIVGTMLSEEDVRRLYR